MGAMILDPSDLTTQIRKHVQVCPECDCWIFTGKHDKDGYGKAWQVRKQRWRAAHRWAYELLIGEIPEDYELDHLSCSLHCCVHPGHLQPVPKAENVARAHATRYQGVKFDADGNEIPIEACQTCTEWAANR